MGFCLQLKLLLWKNFTLKKRKPIVLLFELFIPLVLFFILLGIRRKQPAYPVGSSAFQAYPLPSAGVIAIMQAFCDNGVKNKSTGFVNFPNSSVTQFLEKLNNVSKNNNFFQPGFTPNDMDEIPQIYRSIIEDPVAVHDLFTKAATMQIGSMLEDRNEFEDYIVHNFSLPKNALDILFNSSIDMEKVYHLVFGKKLISTTTLKSFDNQKATDFFGKAFPEFSLDFVEFVTPSLEHIDFLLNYLKNQNGKTKTLWEIVQWIFDMKQMGKLPKIDFFDAVNELKDLLFSPSGISTLICNKKELPVVLTPNSESMEEMMKLQLKLCELNNTELSLFTNALKNHINSTKLMEVLHIKDWNISLAQERIKKLVDDLRKFNEFETTLKELSELASALPLDACYSWNDTNVIANETKEINENENQSKTTRKHEPQYGLLRIWLGMQKTICGKENEVPPTLPVDGSNINLDELGMSEYQQEQVGVLVHVLYSNPKVLYSPNNTAADKIIKKANETFELLDTVTQYAKKMLNISEEIKAFLAQNSTEHSLSVLQKIRQNLKNHPLLLKVLNSIALQQFAEGSVIVDKDIFLQQLDTIDNAACSWISLMSGLNLNMFEGFKNEDDLMSYVHKDAFFKNVTVLASVIFNMKEDGSLPNHMIYKIRQNASFTSTTNLVRNRFWFPGPRNWGYSYYQFGFLWIQDVLERAMINLYTDKDVIEPGGYVHQFPYPCYIQDQFLFMIEHVMPLCLAISWVYSVAMLVQNIVYEKEQRLKEVMKTMGLNSAVHWLAWFITSFAQMTITAAILTIILKYGLVLTYSNPLLIFLMLEIFVIANISFSFLVSVVYSKAKLAAACAGIIYFLTYVPYMYIAVREEAAHDRIPAWLKSLASLLSTTAFGLGAKYFAFYEEVGVGVQWSNIDISPVEDDEFSLWNVAIMMVMDTFLYSLLVWYIENVHPGSYGLPKPWYFPFTKSYWIGTPKTDAECGCFNDCLNKIMNKSHWGLSVTEEDQACAMANRTHDIRFFEPDPEHLPLGVCIDNLVKVYKTGNKLAVNKLSLNLYEGQITSFLGHNGAGKTTTMSILTGLFPPTSGYATIYGHDIRTEMEIIRQSMGMCPQHNVLFDELTVEEHLWFYSKLKGTPDIDLKDEMDKMIEDLNLPLKRKSKVDYLSGGMKRKLSVAIAFVGGSQVVILDEPTAGVDPYSRRAIWDLILKYKHERTILLSTHHMDEADILGDRIAIISNGQLRCCGTSLFLKNNLGEGYHLYIVKKPLSSPPVETEVCDEKSVTNFISQHVTSAYLVAESKHELHYVLPMSELRKGSFEKLFTALENSLTQLRISSYGIKTTTLEEVFLQVAENGQIEVETSPKSRPLKPMKKMSNGYHSPDIYLDDKDVFLERDDEGSVPLLQVNDNYNQTNGISLNFEENVKKKQADDGKADYLQLKSSPLLENNISQRNLNWEGAGTYKIEGKFLLLQQFNAILLKRFYCTKRNWKGLFSQILLPAFFVSIAMSVALTAPKIEDLPPLILSPSQYYNYTQPEGNVIPFSNNLQDIHGWSNDADSTKLVRTLVHMPSGVGATCVLKNPFNNSFDDRMEKLNFSVRNFELLSDYFEPSCESVFVPGLPLENFVPSPPTASPPIYNGKDNINNNSWLRTTEPPTTNKKRFYPYCHCSADKTGYVCPSCDCANPYSYKVVTGDILLDINSENENDRYEQNEHEYYLYTTDMYRLRRYGAFSFGWIRDYVPEFFGKDAPSLFRKIAVRNVAKVWYNNKGYHSMPTYVNSLNNAILRANLPKSKGNPSAYGITVINHPMTDTSYMLSKDQILQGTDVLIAIFIIVAMSFVPASFVLFLVYERYIKAKHLQYVSGVNAVIYWVANYFWDMCSYVVPATCCVLILLIFDIPAYTSHKNFPAVVSLFLIYGWSITPMMYPVSFLFKEPSTAYIFLIVINLFVGITCVVTSFLLEVFSYDAYLGEVHELLKMIFLLFPNYCLGRGLMDIAFNEYQNFFLFKTGQYDKMKSPFAWNLVTRNLIAMAFSGLVFFFITLLCEFNFFRKPKNVKVPEYVIKDEDVDVAFERRRVLTGQASNDILHLDNLTKVYQTRKLGKHLAVDRLCLGVSGGECLGLLGVNGAGKSTTFKMLTGDTSITAGDAFLNGYSIRNDLHKIRQFIGYCPQFDALYDELTAREHLQLYSRFRGIPPKEEKKVIEWALKKLDLIQYADRPSGTYSGGNKRKLSTAIALLGAPPLIYMDEPTTGMDPYTRRFLWDLVIELVKSNRSVVFTSHSMEECEALCTRLAIMVNGHFKCLGSIQHLKNRFGEGYYIILRTKDCEQEIVQRWFRRTFPDATLKEKHFNMLQYELKSENISLAYVFSKMESALNDLPIDEYSVCQNTLDNVFINFVKQQSDIGSNNTNISLRHCPTSSSLDESLDGSEDDIGSQIQRSHSRLAFVHMDVEY